MSEYELDRDDFRLIDAAFNALQRTADRSTADPTLIPLDYSRADALQNRFAQAHSGYLDIDESTL